MKIVSWNVNGLRSIVRKGFHDFVENAAPDVLCLQEIRANPDQIELAMPRYHAIWHSAERKGYAGTAVFCQKEPLSVTRGMAGLNDSEGRVLLVEFADFQVISVYVPNSKRDLSRLDYRVSWDEEFSRYCKTVAAHKPVVICGDFNVAHEEIDLARPKGNHKTHGFTREERKGFSTFLDSGFVDGFRHFHPDGGHYTWWSQLGDCRERNIGWRIDYTVVSHSLVPRMQRAKIMKEQLGSDHCPVALELD